MCGATDATPSDGFVSKTDLNGVVQWTKKIGGSQEDVINVVRPTSDGGYIAVGYTKSAGAEPPLCWCANPFAFHLNYGIYNYGSCGKFNVFLLKATRKDSCGSEGRLYMESKEEKNWILA